MSRKAEARLDSRASDEASDWLRGEADLKSAGMGQRLTLSVQLGVLAHAGIDRLVALGRYSRRASVRRSWGTDMAELAGDVARCAGSPLALECIQTEFLIPLELAVLAGNQPFVSRQEFIAHVRERIPL